MHLRLLSSLLCVLLSMSEFNSEAFATGSCKIVFVPPKAGIRGWGGRLRDMVRRDRSGALLNLNKSATNAQSEEEVLEIIAGLLRINANPEEFVTVLQTAKFFAHANELATTTLLSKVAEDVIYEFNLRNFEIELSDLTKAFRESLRNHVFSQASVDILFGPENEKNLSQIKQDGTEALRLMLQSGYSLELQKAVAKTRFSQFPWVHEPNFLSNLQVFKDSLQLEFSREYIGVLRDLVQKRIAAARDFADILFALQFLDSHREWQPPLSGNLSVYGELKAFIVAEFEKSSFLMGRLKASKEAITELVNVYANELDRGVERWLRTSGNFEDHLRNATTPEELADLIVMHMQLVRSMPNTDIYLSAGGIAEINRGIIDRNAIVVSREYPRPAFLADRAEWDHFSSKQRESWLKLIKE